MHRVSRLLVALIVLALVSTLGTAVVPTALATAQSQPVDAASATTNPGIVEGWGRPAFGAFGSPPTGACQSSEACAHPSNGIPTFGVTAVSAGHVHTLLLGADGTVWAVGDNRYGQLGNGTEGGSSLQPVRVPLNSGAHNFIAVSAGAYQSLALDSDGHVFAWGRNNGGGNPAQVASLSSVTAISAGGGDLFPPSGADWEHNLALLSNGTVMAWGDNDSGQLGDGTTTDQTTPVAVSGLSDAIAIAAGTAHSLAVRSNGTVVAWGANGSGQLGDATNDDAHTPVAVSGLTGIVAVDANVRSFLEGAPNSIALKNDGTVWVWGANTYGQLGNGTCCAFSNPTPSQVNGITTATAVSAGSLHMMALLADGTVKTWGKNSNGQLGDGTTTDSYVPVTAGPTPPIGAIDGGGFFSVAIAKLGSLGEYTSMTPARFLDTRADGVTADGQYRATGMISQGGSQDVQITGRNGVPSTGVSAVVLNATVTEPTQPSFLTVWPTGFTRPTASNLNYVPGETVPNLVTVALGVGGKVSVYNHNGSTHAVFDVVGYYSSIAGPDGTRVHMITPARIMDTRGLPTIDGQSQGGGSVGQNQTRDLDVTGRGGVPASNVTAVVVNVTVTEPTMSSYVTAYPSDVAKPNASNLNFVPGETVPNLAIVRVPASGIVRFYNLFGNTHLVVDVVGYFDDDESTDAGRVIPLFPGRLFDTRGTGFGPLPANQTLSLSMATFNAGITNAQASGYVLNVTVTEPSADGYLTVYPGDVARPLASNLNFVGGQTVPNLVMTKVGCPTVPRINFYNSPFGSTHLLADAFGVITNSLKFDTTVCAPPAVPAELGAEETRELDAPAFGATLQLGVG